MSLDFKNQEDAKKFIKETTRQDLDTSNDAKGHKSTVIDHKVMANAFVKYINAITDMPKVCKKIMTLKLMNPGITNYQIALGMGMLVDEVDELEVIGKRITEKYLEVVPLQEGIDKFNHMEFARVDVEKLRLPPGNSLNAPKNNANPNDVEKLI